MFVSASIIQVYYLKKIKILNLNLINWLFLSICLFFNQMFWNNITLLILKTIENFDVENKPNKFAIQSWNNLFYFYNKGDIQMNL
jgi:uncharacterized membrane protein